MVHYHINERLLPPTGPLAVIIYDNAAKNGSHSFILPYHAILDSGLVMHGDRTINQKKQKIQTILTYEASHDFRISRSVCSLHYHRVEQ